MIKAIASEIFKFKWQEWKGKKCRLKNICSKPPKYFFFFCPFLLMHPLISEKVLNNVHFKWCLGFIDTVCSSASGADGHKCISFRSAGIVCKRKSHIRVETVVLTVWHWISQSSFIIIIYFGNVVRLRMGFIVDT